MIIVQCFLENCLILITMKIRSPNPIVYNCLNVFFCKNSLKLHFLYVCTYDIWAHSAMVCTRWSEHNLREFILSIMWVPGLNSGHIRLGSRHLTLLAQIPKSYVYFENQYTLVCWFFSEENQYAPIWWGMNICMFWKILHMILLHTFLGIYYGNSGML